MAELMISKDAKNTVPVFAIAPDMTDILETLVSSSAAKIAETTGFSGQAGRIVQVQNGDGTLDAILFGVGNSSSPMDAGKLARNLPDGDYRLEGLAGDPYLAALGWLLGAYRFEKYKASKLPKARLSVPDSVDLPRLTREVEAAFLARDLINTPANDMGPAQLEQAIRNLATAHKAEVDVTMGEALLEKNFPMIHAVGRASVDAPRLIDMIWGEPNHPKLTLVGKGVIFDTGGLNIKPGSSMALMKKDMGGAANVIALAQMIMKANLPVRLRLLVPAVENAISGNAFRPGDVLQSRKGITVEIGNTDAEGRLVLGDALTLGDEEKPDLMIDMATLTGAARVALGPDLPPFYTHDDLLAQNLSQAGDTLHDPVWRMPLWAPYKSMLSSKIADINHITSGSFAGSITAALFLSKFVEHASSWVHLDVFGWVPSDKPWATVGGEAQGIRALFKVIEQRYS